MASKFYDNSGKPKRMRQICQRCGDGTFLAEHSDRRSCGKCGYTEFKSQKHEE